MSYFQFIRWLFLFNLFVCILTLIFIILPQSVYSNNSFNLTLTLSSSECTDILSGTSNTTDQYTITQCCTLDYKSYINTSISKTKNERVILDIIQGTVSHFTS